MRERILKKLAAWHTAHPWRMLILMLVVTVIAMGLAKRLDVTMRTQDLLPENDIRVKEFNRILDEFNTATSLIMVVQGEEKQIKQFAEEVAPRILELKDCHQNEVYESKINKLQQEAEKLKAKNESHPKLDEIQKDISYYQNRINMPLFQRVDYKAEKEFMKKHGLMLVKADDLQNTKEIFTDPNLPGLITNINNALENEYVGQEESISTREKEDGAVGFLDGIEHLVNQLQHAADGEPVCMQGVEETADKLLFGEPYLLSYDKSTLILNVIPNFTFLDRDLLMVGTDMVQELLDEKLVDYPSIQAGLSGDIAREHDEQIASEKSLSFTTIIAFAAILVLLIVAFRMLSAPLIAMVNLIVGVIWAMGVAYLLAGQLNMMTAMLSIVLLGLGIDFSIHMISGFTEWRAAGHDIQSALENTFLKIGKGIITGALTTSCAFLALLISQSRGMKEMGLVTGAGLLAMMIATFLFLPTLLVIREKRRDRRNEKKGRMVIKKDISFRALGNMSLKMSKNYAWTLIGTGIISVILILYAFKIEYNQNWLSMEPEGLTSIALTDTIMHKFDMSMDYTLCLAESVEESRELVKAFRDHGNIAMVTDISRYLPSKEEQDKRKPYLEEIKRKMEKAPIFSSIQETKVEDLLEQLDRLEMNVMEMQDMAYIGGQDKVDEKCQALVGNPDISESKLPIRNLINTITLKKAQTLKGLSQFQKEFAPYYKKNVLGMCSTEPIELADLPIQVLDQFSNKDRDLFMLTVYPATSLFKDNRVLNQFVDDMEKISPKTTGSPAVAVAWMRIAARDGRNAILLTLVIVFILLWVDLGKAWYALMAMSPLILGGFWMVGIMQLTGQMLNFMTMMGIPLILGIGIDDGVHLMHRWKEEGHGKIHTVFSSTGKAILLTSLTTMLAFGSMVFSVFPAWMYFGLSLFIGVGTCFLTSILVLAGIIGWIERKQTQTH